MKHVNSIIAVDDDNEDLRILQELNEYYGFNLNIVSYNSVEEALTHFHLQKEPRKPCLILMDYNMPQVNGVQGINMFKSIPETSGTPIVIFSTANDQKFKDSAFRSGAANFIVKPGHIDHWNLFLKWLTQVCANHIPPTTQFQVG